MYNFDYWKRKHLINLILNDQVISAIQVKSLKYLRKFGKLGQEFTLHFIEFLTMIYILLLCLRFIISAI